LAARLCGEAQAGQILASQRVASAVEELARVEPVGALQLKGFVKPVPAFNITGLKPT
jgi:class 3 adenylate cyclase